MFKYNIILISNKMDRLTWHVNVSDWRVCLRLTFKLAFYFLVFMYSFLKYIFFFTFLKYKYLPYSQQKVFNKKVFPFQKKKKKPCLLSFERTTKFLFLSIFFIYSEWEELSYETIRVYFGFALHVFIYCTICIYLFIIQ